MRPFAHHTERNLMGFADGFVMYATAGTVTFRYIGASLADALSWKALKEDDGYRVSEPVPYDRAGDNVVAFDGTKGAA